MSRRLWIETGLASLLSILLIGCMGNRPSLQSCQNNTGSGCAVSVPLTCTATPSASAIASGSDLSINIAASGGLAPYKVLNPKTNTQISFSNSTAILKNYTFSVSTSTVVTGSAAVTDAQGVVQSCSWTITQVPNNTASLNPLVCSIQISDLTPTINAPLNVNISAAGGNSSNYVFGYLNYDNLKQTPVPPNSGAQRFVTISYTSTGQKILSTTVSDGTKTASCSRMLTVLTPSLSLSYANGISTVPAGSTLSVNAVLSGGASNAGVVYQFQSSNPSVSVVSNQNGSATLSAVGLNAQSAVITAYASIAGNVIASNSISANFSQNSAAPATTIPSTTMPNPALVGCTLKPAKTSISLYEPVGLAVAPIGGSGSYQLYLAANLTNGIIPPAAGGLTGTITYYSAGNGVIVASLLDRIRGNTVSCSVNIAVITTTQIVYRMDDFGLVNDNIATWGSMAFYYTQNPSEAGVYFKNPSMGFKSFTSSAGTLCNAQLYKCGYFRPQGDARQFLSSDPNCQGYLRNGSAVNPSVGYVCTSQQPGTTRLYEWYRSASEGRLYSTEASSEILTGLGFVRSETFPVIYVPIN